MHKEYFLLKLKYGLMSLPAEDRDEILAEYSAHFAFGEQQGRTEEEIARELGDPEELAVELLGARDEEDSGGNEGLADQPAGFYRPDMHWGPDMQGQATARMAGSMMCRMEHRTERHTGHRTERRMEHRLCRRRCMICLTGTGMALHREARSALSALSSLVFRGSAAYRRMGIMR